MPVRLLIPRGSCQGEGAHRGLQRASTAHPRGRHARGEGAASLGGIGSCPRGATDGSWHFPSLLRVRALAAKYRARSHRRHHARVPLRHLALSPLVRDRHLHSRRLQLGGLERTSATAPHAEGLG